MENPLEWHQHNRRLNPDHYAAGAWWDRWLQTTGGSIYYLTDVVLSGGCGGRLKYGVIGLDAFLDDLYHWRHLYVAGRLHKPVLSLTPASGTILAALAANRSQALRTALLTLPACFTGRALLERIVSLSYWGDWRTSWAEDPQKIARIVRGQGASLWGLYRQGIGSRYVGGRDPLSWARPPRPVPDNPFTGSLDTASNDPSDDPLKDPSSAPPALDYPCDITLEQDTSPIARLCELTKLPKSLGDQLVRRHASLYALARDPHPAAVPEAVKKAVASLVRPAAIVQPCKGLLTAGLRKSLAYSIHKIKRRLF